MFTRRDFAARLTLGAAALRISTEMAYAQRAAVKGAALPANMVWLNANENPAGPPEPVLGSHAEALPTSNRYHYQEFARDLQNHRRQRTTRPQSDRCGAGSSEVLHTAVDAFTSATRPLITVTPAYELPPETARALGRPVVLTKLRDDYTADVKALAAPQARPAAASSTSAIPTTRPPPPPTQPTSIGWWPTCPPTPSC